MFGKHFFIEMVCTYYTDTFFVSLPKNLLCGQHFPVTPIIQGNNGKGRTKKTPKTYFSKAQHGKCRQRTETRAGWATLYDCPSYQTRWYWNQWVQANCTWNFQFGNTLEMHLEISWNQWVQAKCSVQARVTHSIWVGAAVSTMPNCPCLYQLGRVGNLKISFRFLTVSFFQLPLSVGAKLHTGIPEQLLKHPHRKYFPDSD